MHVRLNAWFLSTSIVALVACSSDRDAPATAAEPRPTRAAAATSAPADPRSVLSVPPALAADPPGAAAPATVVPPGGAEAVAPTAPPSAPGAASSPPPAPREIEGLRITPNADGTIRIEGTDRWGGDATTTYESVEFLEPALPVLERSLTPAQVAGLTQLVAELRGR
jgi:hypothetical protein